MSLKRFANVVEHAGTGLKMPEPVARKIDDMVKSLALPKDFGYRRIARKAAEFNLNEGERCDISYISTDDVDRDGEVVVPTGGDWSTYNKVVTFAHQYDQLPVGSNVWMNTKAKGNREGILAKTHYPTKPADWGDGPWLPSAVLHLMQQPVPTCTGKSIGFLPTRIREATPQEKSQRPELDGVPMVDKWIGIEYAVAPIECNPAAEMEVVSKALKAGVFDKATADFLQNSLAQTKAHIVGRKQAKEPMPKCYKCGTNDQMIPLRGSPEKKFYRCEKCRIEYSADAKIGPLKVEREDPITVNEKVFTVEQVCKAIKGLKEGFQPLIPTYTQYTEDANGFEPERAIKLAPDLASDAYRIEPTPWGVRFAKMRPQTDELYHFKNSTTEQVLAEIDKFWDLKADYDKLGIMHNRGIILHGPPGSGKTSALHQAAEMVVGRGDVVLYAKSIRLLIEALTAFREIEPDRKTVVVLEDADEFVGYSERDFLQLLDGEQSIGGILYLATTNYISSFPPRLLRSGRFDKKLYVGPPPYEGRLAYLNHKLNGIEPSKTEIDRLATVTDGLSFGDLRELVTAVYALKEPVTEVVSRLCGKSILSMKTYMQKTMTDANTTVTTDEDMPDCPKCMSSANVTQKDEGGMYTCSMCGDDFSTNDDPDSVKSIKSLNLNGACATRAKILIGEGKINHGEWSAPVGSERKAEDCLAIDSEAADAEKYKYPIIKNGELYSKGVGNAAARAEQNGATAVAEAAKRIAELIASEGGTKALANPHRSVKSKLQSVELKRIRDEAEAKASALQALADVLTLARGQ